MKFTSASATRWFWFVLWIAVSLTGWMALDAGPEWVASWGGHPMTLFWLHLAAYLAGHLFLFSPILLLPEKAQPALMILVASLMAINTVDRYHAVLADPAAYLLTDAVHERRILEDSI